jgi:hypothetical protein
MRMRKIRERDVLIACMRLLRWRGWLVQRNNTGTLHDRYGTEVRYGCVGSSDIYAIIPRSGRWLCVETKRPGGRESAAQRAFRLRIVAMGGVAVVIDDVSRLAKLLDELEKDPWMKP